MKQKDRVLELCKENLASRGMERYFDEKYFDHTYRKNNGNQCNAYLLSLKAADCMILNAQFIPDDTRNED